MTSSVASVIHSTVPRYPNDEYDAATDSPLESVRQHNLVLDGDKVFARWPTHGVFPSHSPPNVLDQHDAATDSPLESVRQHNFVLFPTNRVFPSHSPPIVLDQRDAATDSPLELVRQHNFVLLPTNRVFPSHPPPIVLIGFTNALDPAALDITTDFISDNESVLRLTGARTSTQVEAHLNRLFSTAHEEQFEAGMESRFSRVLQQLYARDPNAVLQSLRAKLIGNNAGPEVLAEMLQWTSRQEESTLRDLVVNLLSTGLNNTSPLVRDAAALGLACLDEDTAIGYLKRAIEKERVTELHKDLEDLVHSLET